MKCCHDPFRFECSLVVEPTQGGSQVYCVVCQKVAVFSVAGIRERVMQAGRGPESVMILDDDERKAIHEEFNADPSYAAPETPPDVWHCDVRNTPHPIGEPCACTPR